MYQHCLNALVILPYCACIAPDDGCSVTAPDKLENCRSYLKSLYKVKSQDSSYSQDQWPPPVTNKVFRLALVKADRLRTQNVQEEFKVNCRKG